MGCGLICRRGSRDRVRCDADGQGKTRGRPKYQAIEFGHDAISAGGLRDFGCKLFAARVVLGLLVCLLKIVAMLCVLVIRGGWGADTRGCFKRREMAELRLM